MAQYFRDYNIQVGLGITPTIVLGTTLDVQTENNAARLLMTFPTAYSTWMKIIDIEYVSASEIATVESYQLSYSSVLEKYFFEIDRKFSYNKKARIQFRARNPDTMQESVDPTILSLVFKNAIKDINLETIDAAPTPQQTVILQNFVTEHAVHLASSEETGHVMVDNDTIVIDDNGVISAKGGTTVITDEDEYVCSFYSISGGFDTLQVVKDSKGYIHGICRDSLGSEIYYFTDKIEAGTETIKIYPSIMVSVGEEFPLGSESYINNCVALGNVHSDSNYYNMGIMMKFDLTNNIFSRGTYKAYLVIPEFANGNGGTGEYAKIIAECLPITSSWTRSDASWTFAEENHSATIGSEILYGPYIKSSLDITTQYQTWSLHPSTNPGLFIKPYNVTNGNFVLIKDSRSDMIYSDFTPYILIKYNYTDPHSRFKKILLTKSFNFSIGLLTPHLFIDADDIPHVIFITQDNYWYPEGV